MSLTSCGYMLYAGIAVFYCPDLSRKVQYLQINNCWESVVTCDQTLEIVFAQAESEDRQRRATDAQAEADRWKARFEAERNLRRALNAKVLDMQVRS